MKKVVGHVRRILVELFWNFVIVVLTVTACYVLYMSGKFDRFLKKPAAPAPAVAASAAVAAKPSAQPVVSASAEQVAPAPAQPAPAEAAPAATPEPASTPAVASAAPTPEQPLNLESVDQRSLPLQVKLSQPVDFPIVSHGQQVGSTASPAGMMVRLLGVQGDQLIVQCAGVRRLIPASATDVVSRVRALQQYTSGTPAAATASAPASTPWVPMLKSTH